MLDVDGAAAGRKRRSPRRIVILLYAFGGLLAVAVLVLHWLRPDYDPEHSGNGAVVFSPDGKTVAYLWEGNRVEELGTSQRGTYYRIERWLDLRWFPLGRKEAEESVRIWQRTWPRIEIMGFFPTTPCSAPSFSPDGRHLAMDTWHDLRFVELATGRKWTLTHEGGRITSSAWLAGDEVAYFAVEDREPGPDKGAVWRRKITAPPSEPTLVHRCAVGRGASPRDWSANGKYVIFPEPNQPPDGGQGILLDVRTGRATKLPPLAECHSVRWKPDSSLAAIQCEPGLGPTYLLDPVTGHLVDLTDRFKTAFAGWAWYGIDNGWTADGRYLLVQTKRELLKGSYGAWLLRPEPWELVTVGPDMLRATNVPGWVLYGTPGTGQYGFNHVTGQYIPLKRMIGPQFSPDGKWAFEGGFHPLRVYPVNLPPAY